MSEYISRAPFATISISTRFLTDARLSLHAFRVAAFVFGQDPEKPFVKARLAATLGIGRSTLDRALAELTELGYRTPEGHITDQPVLSQDTSPGDSVGKCLHSGQCPEPGHFSPEGVPSQDTPAAQAPVADVVRVRRGAGAGDQDRATTKQKKEEDVRTHTPGQGEVRTDQHTLPIAAEMSPAETLSEPASPKRTRKPKARSAYTEDFELAWEGYGRQGNKRPAFVAWEKALANGADVETILTGILAYLESERVQRGYKQDFSTWLNGEGWESDWVSTKKSKLQQVDEEMARGDFRHVGNAEAIDEAIAQWTPEERRKYGVPDDYEVGK